MDKQSNLTEFSGQNNISQSTGDRCRKIEFSSCFYLPEISCYQQLVQATQEKYQSSSNLDYSKQFEFHSPLQMFEKQKPKLSLTDNLNTFTLNIATRIQQRPKQINPDFKMHLVNQISYNQKSTEPQFQKSKLSNQNLHFQFLKLQQIQNSKPLADNQLQLVESVKSYNQIQKFQIIWGVPLTEQTYIQKLGLLYDLIDLYREFIEQILDQQVPQQVLKMGQNAIQNWFTFLQQDRIGISQESFVNLLSSALLPYQIKNQTKVQQIEKNKGNQTSFVPADSKTLFPFFKEFFQSLRRKQNTLFQECFKELKATKRYVSLLKIFNFQRICKSENENVRKLNASQSNQGIIINGAIHAILG